MGIRNHHSAHLLLLKATTKRLFESADEFFPPQIVQMLQNFASIGYSDEDLIGVLVSRIDDLCENPSPKRITEMLRIFASLHFHHPLVVIPLKEKMLEKMHDFTYEIPSLLNSLALLFEHDRLSIDQLATQAFLKKDSLGSEYCSVVEKLSHHGYCHESFVSDVDQLMSSSLKPTVFSVKKSLKFYCSCLRLGYPQQAKQLRNRILTVLGEHTFSASQLATLLEEMYTMRLRDDEIQAYFIHYLENRLKNTAFVSTHCLRFMTVLAGVSSTESSFLLTVINSNEMKRLRPSLSAYQLCQLLYDTCLLLHASPNARNVIMTDFFSDILSYLKRCHLQMNLNFRRKLLECVFFIQYQQISLSAESAEFCSSVEKIYAASQLPSSPTNIPYESMELKQILGRNFLINSEAKDIALAYVGSLDLAVHTHRETPLSSSFDTSSSPQTNSQEGRSSASHLVDSMFTSPNKNLGDKIVLLSPHSLATSVDFSLMVTKSAFPQGIVEPIFHLPREFFSKT
ncbi:hypothetical protein IE077_002638 [Cardiosporidium cionae]|uniref:Uncharacterized protein n=1 Tax=Cardiosporidium cionae TaxID=476202 RepID=A0ABQ7JAH5_9APIC|nr:hypothetical protein IE077_002638 [Cardiosporidium cionae]|eukprot:KAF8820934.1 hypothetical protein IE077_002638 [Cardiosporidium cionae]